MKKSTWQHLRIPFSFFLMPVFLFSASLAPSLDWGKLVLVFFILHFLLYPASNGYNSYFDKDKGSIGGLKNPPKVTKELYFVPLIFDILAILLGLLIGWQFCLMLFGYGLVSKAYSHPSIRLKKMPIVGWLAAGLFQGYFTFIMVYIALTGLSVSDTMLFEIQFPALLSSLLLWGSYPMTQVYQHGEDSQRGDITLSLKLGVLGTFHFTAIFFSIANAGFFWYYWQYLGLATALAFQLTLVPMLGYFLWWYIKVRGDQGHANFDNTMRLNMLSSLMLNLFFGGMMLI